jgi:hypothetical protein
LLFLSVPFQSRLLARYHALCFFQSLFVISCQIVVDVTMYVLLSPLFLFSCSYRNYLVVRDSS